MNIRYPPTLNPYFHFYPFLGVLEKTTRGGNISMENLYPIICVVDMERCFYVENIIYEKNYLTIYVHPNMGYLLLDRVKYKNSVFSWIFDEKT